MSRRSYTGASMHAQDNPRRKASRKVQQRRAKNSFPAASPVLVIKPGHQPEWRPAKSALPEDRPNSQRPWPKKAHR